jgi:hypothetical protein
LGAAVIRILRDHDLAEELAHRGKERALSFTREKLWPDLKDTMEELLSRRRHGRANND